jgi:CBS domain containing-hemolysin-like protein
LLRLPGISLSYTALPHSQQPDSLQITVFLDMISRFFNRLLIVFLMALAWGTIISPSFAQTGFDGATQISVTDPNSPPPSSSLAFNQGRDWAKDLRHDIVAWEDFVTFLRDHPMPEQEYQKFREGFSSTYGVNSEAAMAKAVSEANNGDDWIMTLLKWLGVITLVFLNGFFVAAEFALVKVRKSRLRRMAQDGIFGANAGLHLLDHLNSYLSACQLGITLTSLGLGWLGEKALAHFFIPFLAPLGIGSVYVHAAISSVLMFATITFLHIVVGEQAPKVFAIQKAEVTTVWISWPLKIFYRIIYPAIWVLNGASLALLRLVGLKDINEHESAHTVDELRTLLQQSSSTDQLTPVAGSLLLNALDLRRRKARQVMLHRTKIAFLSTHRSIEENLKIARQHGYSRYPLCEGSIDQTVGMVHLKDLAWLIHDQGNQANITSIKRDVLFVPETMPLERLLNLFLTRRIHLAILVDEYGTIVGMVTLENILEEIVGDIQDEFDQESLMFQRISDTEYRLHGELPLHDLEELLGLHLSSEDVTTVSGYLIKEFGHFPQNGESIQIQDCIFTVTRTSGHQIFQTTVKRVEPASAETQTVV